MKICERKKSNEIKRVNAVIRKSRFWICIVKKRDPFGIICCVALQLLQTSISGAAKFFEK